MTYGYDAANRLTSVTDWASRQTQYSYDANNRLTGITRPDGRHQTNTYDAKGQLTTAEDRDSQNTLISRYEYTYDAVGNITTETSTTGQGHVETNTFSAVDRITAQAVTENGIPTEQYGYTYDAGGNILTATNNGVTTTFSNGNANRIATVNGQAVTYDDDGNITTAPLNGTPSTFAFDCRNRLASVGNTSYTYNAENQRIGITENGIATSYVINPNATLSQTLIKTTGGASTYYIYGLGLIAEETGTDYKTYHYDLRGSTVALTDSTGLTTDTFSYAPYGELLSHTGTSDVDYLYNGRDGVIADNNGLYQMRARYYSPELRRFLNEDEYAGKYDDILNVNLYAYCEGNPVGFVDPSGHDLQSSMDYFAGITDSVTDALTGNFSRAIRKYPGSEENLDGICYPESYWDGRVAGDYMGLVLGPLEVAVGAIGDGASAGGAPFTFGLTLVGTVPCTAAVVHGGVTSLTARGNLGQDLVMRSSANQGSGKIEFKKPKSGSGKDKATDVPSWAKGNKPYVGQSGNEFATRLMNDKYGEGNWKTSSPEYSQIRKWGDRGFE